MNKKRFTRILLTLLSSMLLISVGLITVSAAEDMYEFNQGQAELESNTLYSEQLKYTQKASRLGISTDIAKNTNKVIQLYREEISNMPHDAEDRTVDLTDDLAAVREQGIQVAKLAWIAYAHSVQELPEYSDTTDNNVLKKFKEYKDRIDITESVTEAQNNIDVYCKEMLQFVFEDNLTILLQAGEQGYGIYGHVEESISKIEALTSSDIDAAPYIEIYDEAVHFVTVRRAYAVAEKELEECIALLGDYSDSAPAKAFADALETVDSIDDVNNALNSAVCGIISLRITESDGHMGAFKAELVQSCNEATALACEKETDENGNAVIADLSLCLREIDLRQYRAYIKDQTEALITETSPSSTLTGIINEYTKNNGILDGCTDKASLDFEYDRATLRVEWYRVYTEHKNAIDIDLRPIAGTTIAREAEELYSVADEDICNYDRHFYNALEACKERLSDAKDAIADLAAQAKAKRFIHDKTTILEKDVSQITLGDEGLLNEAINEYSSLADDVKAYLEAEKQGLNEKYKALASAKIYMAASGEDGQALIDDTNMLDITMPPSELKRLADDNVKRAEALGVLQDKYADVTDAQNFDAYDENTKQALSDDYTNASNAILASNSDNENTLSEVLEGINSNAALSMEKHAAIGEVRLAAKDCELSDVKKTVSDAEAAILADTLADDIHAERDAAIFRIECQKTAADKREDVAALKDKISKLPALSESDKAALSNEADALYADCDDISNAQNRGALDTAVSTFESKLAALDAKADADALAEGKRQAIAEINAQSDKVKEEIKSYGYVDYVTDGTSDTLKAELDGITEDFADNVLAAATGWEELDELKKKALSDIAAVSERAKAAELDGCKESAKDALSDAFAHPEYYSDTNRANAQRIFDDCIDDVERANSVDEVHSLRDGAIAEIAGIPTMLDEAKSAALERLDDAYTSLEKDKHCYSSDVWSEIEGIYSHTVAEIKLLTAFSDREKAGALADERIALMRAKKRDTVYTSDGLLASGAGYSDGYDHIRNGYSASVTAKGQVPYDTTLSVFPFTDDGIEEIIRKAVKNKSVFMSNGDVADKKLIKSLKGCNVITGLDVAYSYSEAEISGSYTVKILLPSNLDAEGLLGVVYVRADGSVEYFETTYANGALTFETPHFSSFYLISEKTVNLLPLIIILAIILAAEAAVIAFMIFRRMRASKDKKLASVMPFMPIVALARILPKGGIAISVILGALVLAAGGAIAYLIMTEKKKVTVEESVEAVEEEPTPEPLPVIEEPSPVLVLQAVTVEEANELMSDSDAAAAIEEAPNEAVYSTHGKKYEVNIDSISAVFEPDETVSLATLKEKGLVPKSAKAVKILARGTLDKPLTVIAQDFSTAAVKMITLTGGHAMIVERE